MKSYFKIVLALSLLVPFSCNKQDIKEEIKLTTEDTYEIVLGDSELSTKAGGGLSSVEMTLVIAPNNSVTAYLYKNNVKMTSGYKFEWTKSGSHYGLSSDGSYEQYGYFTGSTQGSDNFTVSAKVDNKIVATKTLPGIVNPAPKLTSMQITSPSSYIPYGNDYDVDVKLTYSDGTVLTRDDLSYNHCEDFLSASVSGSTIKVDTQDKLRIDGISGKLGSSTLSVTYNDGNSSKTASQSVTVYVAADLAITVDGSSVNLELANLGSGNYRITSLPAVVAIEMAGEFNNHTTAENVQTSVGTGSLVNRGWVLSGENLDYQNQFQSEFDLSVSINFSSMSSTVGTYPFTSIKKYNDGMFTAWGYDYYPHFRNTDMRIYDIRSEMTDYRQDFDDVRGILFSSSDPNIQYIP